MSLHVEVTGSGPDLALIHGWGMHGGIWDGVRAELARHFRVHALDLPGYGTSTPCQPYDLQALAQGVSEALPSGVNVIGWSLGGLVAQRWALDRPQQVRRLMLVGSSPCFAQRNDWASGIDPVILQAFAQDLDQDYAGYAAAFSILAGTQRRGTAHGNEISPCSSFCQGPAQYRSAEGGAEYPAGYGPAL